MTKPRHVVFALAAAISHLGCNRGDLPPCKAGDDIARALQTARAGRHEALKKFFDTAEDRMIDGRANLLDYTEAAIQTRRAATDRAIRYVAETDAAEWKRLCGN